MKEITFLSSYLSRSSYLYLFGEVVYYNKDKLSLFEAFGNQPKISIIY
jgi:hypothetical protein